jgi:hypothetical protein
MTGQPLLPPVDMMDTKMSPQGNAPGPDHYQLPNTHLTGIGTDNPVINSCAAFQSARERNPGLSSEARTSAHVYHRMPTLAHAPSIPHGGMITFPCNMDRECHARQVGASRFNISTLVHGDYHAGRYGTPTINTAFLQRCGYTHITLDDVVTCFNDIISAHKYIYQLWMNVTANMQGPQVDCILQKLLKLFLML